MDKLRNLALSKRATQSSVCGFSIHNTVEEDAMLAVDGDKETAFHTEREQNPWWQVDLERLSKVEKIVIYNRQAGDARFQNFSVLTSVDGTEWECVFAKCDSRVFYNISIPFRVHIVCRHIRIRLDNFEYLHLREVEIYGEEVSVVRDNPILYEKAKPKTTVFSVLFNEASEFLARLIDNYIANTDDDTYIVINLSPSYVPAQNAPLFPRRVIVFQSNVPRSAFGASLLLGHLESYSYVVTVLGEFDYFAPLASNCLFIRRFLVASAETRLLNHEGADFYVDGASLKTNTDDVEIQTADLWWWQKLNHQKQFLRFLRDDLDLSFLVPMQIEGLFAPSIQWAALASNYDGISRHADMLDPNALVPLEEILPASFFYRYFGKNYTSVCYVLWNPLRTFVRMEQIIQPSWHVPPHFAMVKWFDRNINLPETAAVTTTRGRQLVDLVSQAINLDDLDDLGFLSDLFKRLSVSIDALAVQKYGYQTNVPEK